MCKVVHEEFDPGFVAERLLFAEEGLPMKIERFKDAATVHGTECFHDDEWFVFETVQRQLVSRQSWSHDLFELMLRQFLREEIDDILEPCFLSDESLVSPWESITGVDNEFGPLVIWKLAQELGLDESAHHLPLLFRPPAQQYNIVPSKPARVTQGGGRCIWFPLGHGESSQKRSSFPRPCSISKKVQRGAAHEEVQAVEHSHKEKNEFET